MLNKYKLWNFIALCGSHSQYELNRNVDRSEFYIDVLYDIWESFSDEEQVWLDINAFSKPYGWSDPVARQAEVIELIKKIGKEQPDQAEFDF